MRTNAAGAPAKVVVIMSAIAEWEGLKLLLPDNASRPTPYSESMDVRLGTRDLTFLHSGWGRIASAGALVHDIVELMGDLDIPACYASSLDLSWLADPLPFPVRRGLIDSADGDLASEQGGEVYGDIGTFNERAKGIMRRLFEPLPAWLDAVGL